MQQPISFEISEFLLPVPLHDPIGSQQHPRQIGHKGRCSHAYSQHTQERNVDVSCKPRATKRGLCTEKIQMKNVELLLTNDYSPKSFSYRLLSPRISMAFITSGSFLSIPCKRPFS